MADDTNQSVVEEIAEEKVGRTAEETVEGFEDPEMRSVVITGVSTGIGYALTEELIAHGYQVIGTVRKEEDAKRLRETFGRRMRPVLMDVADDDEIRRAAGEISEIVGERGIAGLVNNAGIAIAGPLMHVDMEEFRYQFDVNVAGVVAMTQAMLPLLGGRKDSPNPPGRVINMSSVSAYVTYPFLAPYASSKYALESISDGLRRELALYGIKVIVMVVGAVQTPIWDKMSEDDLARFAKTDYAPGVAQMRATTIDIGKRGMEATRVARAVRRALEHPNPKPRHIVVNDYWRGWLLPKLIPTRLFDWAMTRQFNLTRID